MILGDVLNHGPRNALPGWVGVLARVAERLNAVATQIIAVRGNCDSEVDQMLLHFPDNRAVAANIDAREVAIFNAWVPLRADESARLHTGDVLVYGHTHSPVATAGRTVSLLIPGQ